MLGKCEVGVLVVKNAQWWVARYCCQLKQDMILYALSLGRTECYIHIEFSHVKLYVCFCPTVLCTTWMLYLGWTRERKLTNIPYKFQRQINAIFVETQIFSKIFCSPATSVLNLKSLWSLHVPDNWQQIEQCIKSWSHLLHSLPQQ